MYFLPLADQSNQFFLSKSNMKYLLCIAFVLACCGLSEEFYASVVQQPKAARQPVCRQVANEVCNQVPKTTYESVTRQQCRDVPDQACATQCPTPRKPEINWMVSH